MAKDFFGNLGQALSKTAKELSGRAEDVYETQRLKNKISAEERQIDKIMADLGKIVYQRYKEEVTGRRCSERTLRARSISVWNRSNSYVQISKI